jgi:ABC-type phosphate transport system substrate-binding protein
MTLRIPKSILIGLAALLLIGIGVAGALALGGDDDGDKAAETTTATTSAPTTDASAADPVNQRIADQFAATNGGKNLAVICQQMARGVSSKVVENQFRTVLGPLVIQQGGDVTTVMNLLLDRC